MKKNSLTLILLYFILQVQVNAQNGVVWHNQGPSFVTGSGQTILYIDGDMKFSNMQNSSAPLPLMSIGNSGVNLQGNLINDVNQGIEGGNLFVPLSGGFFEFGGITPQLITTSGTNNTNIPSKLTNFIDFPTLIINNNKHITINARLAARTKNIELEKGWLILDSQKALPNVDGDNTVDSNNESVLAHLWVDGIVNYNMASWSAGQDINDRGFIQINLQLQNEGDQLEPSIVGLGSPFEHIYLDYFMFNTLTRPMPSSFLAGGAITDPDLSMLAGRGYVVGIDLMGNQASDYTNIKEAYPNIDFNQRAIDGYRFNRSLFHVNSPDNEIFGAFSNSLDAYTSEKLNVDNITVPLTEGYNYLSNPYTTPLNIYQLLSDDPSSQVNDWGVASGEWLDDIDVWNRVWILNTNSRTSYNSTTKKLKYTYSFQVAMKTGGTYIDDDNVPGVTPIAPLQMFAIYSVKDQNITIPKNERKMATSRFLRNTPVNKRKDDFVIEMRNTETKTTDRLSFVLRPEDELGSFSNVTRMANNPGDNDNTPLVYDGIIQNQGSQIYTKDAEGRVLTVQFLPLATTEYVQLYHIPPLVEQGLQVLGRRITSKDYVENLWLEDRLYNITKEITSDMVYETISKPTDPVDRFVVRLRTGTSIEDQSGHKSIYAYTQGSSIIVNGFAESDFGTTISLFDINGRLLTNKTVDASEIHLAENCSLGVYLVRTHNSQPQTFKLIVH